MCFLGSSVFRTKDRGKVAVENLSYDDVLLDLDGGKYEVLNIYKLPEFKVAKMVRIFPGKINGSVPTALTFLKPTQYVNWNGEIIKAKDLVDKFHVGEYEKYNILYFYLVNVRKLVEVDAEGTVKQTGTLRINNFVDVNGMSLSVYNNLHPLNNRFQKYSLPKEG